MNRDSEFRCAVTARLERALHGGVASSRAKEPSGPADDRENALALRGRGAHADEGAVGKLEGMGLELRRRKRPVVAGDVEVLHGRGERSGLRRLSLITE